MFLSVHHPFESNIRSVFVMKCILMKRSFISIMEVLISQSKIHNSAKMSKCETLILLKQNVLLCTVKKNRT